MEIRGTEGSREKGEGGENKEKGEDGTAHQKKGIKGIPKLSYNFKLGSEGENNTGRQLMKD